MNNKREYIDIISCHIIYLTSVNINKSFETFEKNYIDYYKLDIGYKNLYFNLSAYVLFSKLMDKGIKQITINLPIDSPIYKDYEYDVVELKKYFKEITYKLIDILEVKESNEEVYKHIESILTNKRCFVKNYILNIKKLWD
ncbi:hypothetical protein [Clostridium rectalis]|uniref:hypothetical protein n=1 Tax=Clostridium rectalis TaxID=2040295 RepID=UPI000F639BE5|nr:hypothetical protein [Clostridium rectalis]